MSLPELKRPGTASKDLTRKWWAYEAAGVLEYLLVDPEEKVGRMGRPADAAGGTDQRYLGVTLGTPSGSRLEQEGIL
jgi:Uma2 family endonuclease